MPTQLLQTIDCIENYYVDPVALDSIYEKVIPELLYQLDPPLGIYSGRGVR